MTKQGGQRIATSDGAMLADRACIGKLPDGATWASLFEPAFWAGRGELLEVSRGRGAAWFIASGARSWALRHFRRGGFIAHLLADRYVWVGEQRVRAFAEWRLLALLVQQGLPVPKPIAARYGRRALTYRCDLITQRLVDAHPLSVWLERGALDDTLWRGIGATIARFHAAGVDHADLNAHNILIDPNGHVSVIDFDRGRVRAPGPWTMRNLARLRRSLDKIARHLPGDRFPATAWRVCLAGYASGAPLGPVA